MLVSRLLELGGKLEVGDVLCVGSGINNGHSFKLTAIDIARKSVNKKLSERGDVILEFAWRKCNPDDRGTFDGCVVYKFDERQKATHWKPTLSDTEQDVFASPAPPPQLTEDWVERNVSPAVPMVNPLIKEGNRCQIRFANLRNSSWEESKILCVQEGSVCFERAGGVGIHLIHDLEFQPSQLPAEPFEPFPKVGDEYLDSTGNPCVCIIKYEGSAIGKMLNARHDSLTVSVCTIADCKPPLTEEQKAIKALEDDLTEGFPILHFDSKGIATKLYQKGYRKC